MTFPLDSEIIGRYPKNALRILISGSSGFVGSHLIPFLEKGGHEVWSLLRHAQDKEREIYWNPAKAIFNSKDFENFDALILLGGKNIAHGRWTKKVKEEILLSRARDNWLLSHALLRVKNPPKTIICASAIGFYGDGKDQILTEASPKGRGFLADVCEKWEHSTQSIEEKGVRGVHTRFGVILSPKGGMLSQMLPLFRWGLGAILGSGEQYISWIALEDVIYSLYHILMTKDLKGAVNVTAPNPVPNIYFSKKLAESLNRPVFLRIPKKVLELIFGRERADELFFTSTKAIPSKLEASGYRFLYPTLESYFKQRS